MKFTLKFDENKKSVIDYAEIIEIIENKIKFKLN